MAGYIGFPTIFSTLAFADSAAPLIKLKSPLETLPPLSSFTPLTTNSLAAPDDYVKPVAASGTVAAVAEYKSTGWPNFSEKTNRFAFDAHKGKPILNYQYSPKFGLLKAKEHCYQNKCTNNGLYTYVSKE